MSRLAVLMPVRNAAATLVAALNSLAAQTFNDFQLIAVDDGSTDDSANILRARWPEERLLLLTPGRVGLVGALNLGLAEARADLIARMDADDLAHPERLLRQCARFVAEPQLDVLGTRVRCFGEPLGEGFARYAVWQNQLCTHTQLTREIFVESPLAHPTLMMRKALLDRLGGYQDHGWPEDYDLIMRAHLAGARLGKLPEVLLDWRDSPGRATRTQPAYAQDQHQRLKAHYLALGPLAGKRTAVWGAGPLGKRLGRYLTAAGVRLSGYVDIDPKKIGKTRRGLPVVSPDALDSLEAERVVCAVGRPGARELIRANLQGRGLTEGDDFFCAA